MWAQLHWCVCMWCTEACNFCHLCHSILLGMAQMNFFAIFCFFVVLIFFLRCVFFSPLRPKTLIVFHFLLFAATASCSNKKQLKTKKSRSLSRICFGTRSPFYYYYAAQATVFLQTSPTVSSYPIRFFPFFVILQSENLHSVTKKKNRQRSKLQLFAVAVSTSRFWLFIILHFKSSR